MYNKLFRPLQLSFGRRFFTGIVPKGKSIVKGDTSVPLLTQTLGTFWEGEVNKYGDKEVLRVVHQNIRWSFSELNKKVDSFYHGLQELGLKVHFITEELIQKKGDKLGVWMPNNAEWVIAHLATAKAGIILVNVNPAFRMHEIEHAIKLVEMDALLFVPQFKQSEYLHMIRTLIPELNSASTPGKIHSQRFPSLKYLIHNSQQTIPGIYKFEDLLVRDVRLSIYWVALSFSSNISGTTGLPKGAMLTHSNILNNGYFVGERMKLTPKDKLCIPVPLYHCFGLVLGNLAALTHGTSIVYPSAGFDAGATLEAVHNEKCTGLHGVPTMFISELNHPDFKKYNLSSLRTGIMAGSPCPIEVMKKVMESMNLKDMTICYGMTETSPVSFQTELSDPIDMRVETVGRIHPHVEAKVVNPSGDVVNIGEIGELLVRGYLVMKGYYNADKQTKEAINVEGWMHTGDLATIDKNGYCRIVGRNKDCIIRGGENVYPREIEEFLYSHPKIADVQIVGVPDKKYGEVACACVILQKGQQATSEEIKEFCKEKIAHYKIPEYVLFMSEFPMTVTGKIQKFKLRESSAQALGLQDKSNFIFK